MTGGETVFRRTSLSYNRSTFLGGYLGKVDVDAKKVLSQTMYTMFEKVLKALKYITTTTTTNIGELYSYPCGKPTSTTAGVSNGTWGGGVLVTGRTIWD